jgi:RHS repeat-associated protein
VGDMAKVNPFGFSTKYTDNETDLVYYGYRYYSPALGRWLSRDPIEEQGGLNLYAFVNNDPVNKVDVIGRQTWIPYPPPGRNISDTPIYREPSGPGAWDQWNPGGLRGRTGEKDYREWFEFRFPKTVEGAKKEILASIIEKGCSTTPRPSILSGIKPVVIEPDMKKFGDKPQTFWEKRFRIGYFSFKADAASLNWNNPCLFYYQTDIYIYEHTGADPLWHSGSNFFPDILWFSGMFVSRDVKMGHWHMEGYACCKK